MTTIVAVQDEHGSIMIADSQINADGLPYNHQDIVKIVERGKYLMGVAGDFAFMQALLHTWNPPTFTRTYEDDIYRFVVTRVIPSLSEFVTESKIFPDKSNNDDDDKSSFNLLLSIKGELFEIDDDYAVARRQDGRYAIGTGSSFALGAMAAGASAQWALEIAESLDVSTRAPFVKLQQHK